MGAGGRSGAVPRAAAGGRPDAPGSFRRSDISVPPAHTEAQTYWPVPGDEVARVMGELGRFLRDEPRRTSPLVKAALAHHHFLTLQPFAEGPAVNGPLGRFLITLVLRAEGVVAQPLLYPSLHFKENREVYEDHLERVRREGDWESWLAFFLEGITRSAEHAAHTVRRLVALIDEDRARIRGLGRAADSALRVHRQLLRTPILSIPHTGRLLPLTPPTLSSSFGKLEELGIALEVTGRARDRLFTYRKYLDILAEGTEPYAKADRLSKRAAGAAGPHR
jgi:Fic family protein